MRAFIVLALIGAACAVPTQPSRIVGGEPTNIENYPFMACMLYQVDFGLFHLCGGTLITHTAIVSATHCYRYHEDLMWRARLGSKYASSGGSLHKVSKIILHPEYSHRLAINDIAIVKLSSPAVFSNQINSARIAGPGYILPDNTMVYSAGWGFTEIDGNTSEILQHIAVYTINHQLCTERYAYLKTLPETADMPEVTPEMLCTGILDVGGKDACTGDSGGPVIHGGDVLVGITSWGHECAHEIYPGVNVRVSSYTNWIYTNSIN